jgi:hypothetical protein
MAERGHRRAQQEFGREPIMKEYVDLYRDLIEHRK